jgi:hypothetical protein
MKLGMTVMPLEVTLRLCIYLFPRVRSMNRAMLEL